MTEVPLSIVEAAEEIRGGTRTATDLVTTVLARADAYDDTIGSYLARFDEQALAAAALADRELASGTDRGPLHGIPLGVKDIIAVAEGPTTANSLVLDPRWGAGRDAPVITRLRRAGAVITGKVTTMEFAIGAPDPTKPFPLPRNPWDTGTWPGGSSSGTANGVAAGFFLGGLGTDTGASIRLPSAYCGVTGLMPTYGRVPKAGCVPFGFSLDHVGPMARSARDCALLLQAMAGYHPGDPDCADVPVPDFSAGMDAGTLAGIRIGVDRTHHFPDDGDPAVLECFDLAVAELEDLGATVTEVALPNFEEMVAATVVTMLADALAYHRPDIQSRWNDYFVATRRTIAQGALISGADYVQAQRVRQATLPALQSLFGGVDVVAMPTAATGAPPYEVLDAQLGVDSVFRHVHTPYWDAAGNPVVALPMGFTAGGLPVSLQLAGRLFGEMPLLAVADAYQQVTDWHRRLPPLSAVGHGAGR
ncbi:MAG TPA: amidase [Acidimicrobiales bacterium]|nr:amidase [Acidimicrobiales bacterium]